jgi:hypothetical protein
MPRTSLLAAVLLGALLVASAIDAHAQFSCVPANCDDGDPCTSDVCVLGSCRHFQGLVCDDANLCTADFCQPGTGACTHTVVVVCNDNNACTTEACNPATGTCQTTGNTSCNDSNLCTSEACNPSTGQCQTTSFVTCNDNNVCTTEACNAATGACQHLSNWCGKLSDLALGIASRGSKFTFKRKQGGKPPLEYVKVTMSQIIVTTRSGLPEKVKVGVKATITGEEAQLASLIYPLKKLTHGAAAATDLQNSGWDFDVVDTSRPCQDVLSSDECLTLAHQLSKTIDASLVNAPVEERDGFRQAAAVLGVPPDDCGRSSP